MAYEGYLRLGDTEIVNTERAYRHAMHGICSRNLELLDDYGWSQTHVWLGEPEPVTPAATGAPWVDEDEPASLEFGGVIGTSVKGLGTTEIEQDVEQATGDGGFASPRRLPARVINVECALIAASSRGLQWGLRWLTRSLMDSGCEGNTGPRDLIFLDSVPDYRQAEAEADLLSRINGITRLLTRVVVTQAPEVDELMGVSMLRGDTGACTALVTFELTALVPRVWRSPVTLLEPKAMIVGEQISTRFTNVATDGSCPAVCDDDEGVLTDPANGPLWTLPRPVAPGADIGCQLLDSRRRVFTIPESLTPSTGEMLPTVTVRTGAREERHVRIRWARGIIVDDGPDLDCKTVGEAMATYVPPESTLILDGRSGTAVVHTADGRALDATPVMVGRGGGPWRAPIIRCGAPYTLVVDTDVQTDLTVEATGVTGEV